MSPDEVKANTRCPKCDAAAGDPCRSITARSGSAHAMSTLHNERWRAAGKEPGRRKKETLT